MAGFEELLVYQRAATLSDEIRAFVRQWEPLDAWNAGTQLLRAADSVAANIAEATGRWTLRDQARLLIIARGSLTEAEHWLARAAARGLPLPEDARPRMREIGRMLNGMTRSARARSQLGTGN
jgi:four helix bundle protein